MWIHRGVDCLKFVDRHSRVNYCIHSHACLQEEFEGVCSCLVVQASPRCDLRPEVGPALDIVNSLSLSASFRQSHFISRTLRLASVVVLQPGWSCGQARQVVLLTQKLMKHSAKMSAQDLQRISRDRESACCLHAMR